MDTCVRNDRQIEGCETKSWETDRQVGKDGWADYVEKAGWCLWILADR